MKKKVNVRKADKKEKNQSIISNEEVNKRLLQDFNDEDTVIENEIKEGECSFFSDENIKNKIWPMKDMQDEKSNKNKKSGISIENIINFEYKKVFKPKKEEKIEQIENIEIINKNQNNDNNKKEINKDNFKKKVIPFTIQNINFSIKDSVEETHIHQNIVQNEPKTDKTNEGHLEIINSLINDNGQKDTITKKKEDIIKTNNNNNDNNFKMVKKYKKEINKHPKNRKVKKIQKKQLETGEIIRSKNLTKIIEIKNRNTPNGLNTSPNTKSPKSSNYFSPKVSSVKDKNKKKTSFFVKSSFIQERGMNKSKNNKFNLQEESKTQKRPNSKMNILANKINNEISKILENNEKLFFNENNKLFFLSFCDILFELGFLHIKETEINDINEIGKNINNLCTQPFTNRKILCPNFVYNEQKLLICAWRTILNNFKLTTNFDSLPKNDEEISIDDCKLFIFIITGLFIGYKNNSLNNSINSCHKHLTKVKSFLKINSPKTYNKIVPKVHLKKNISYNNLKQKKQKYHFRKKTENEDILNKIEGRRKLELSCRNVVKIKIYFNYFAEIRNLFNLYKSEKKVIDRRKISESNLTFSPITNKENNNILKKFAPKMNFFQRNDLIKKRNDKKMILLQKENEQNKLKECTFEPSINKIKQEKKEEKEEKIPQILNYKKHIQKDLNILDPLLKRNKICFTQKSSAENSNISENSKNKSIKYPNTITNRRKGSKSNTSNKNIHSKIQNSSTFSKKNEKKEYYFSPSINKGYKIGKFKNSPLKDDAMLNNRIKKLRENNYEKIVNNYEKNARINLADDIKKNKKAIKELISLQEKGMRMGIEKKSNKDTFDNYLNFDMVNPEDDKLISNNKFLEPLFTMEIKIKQNIKKLQVFEDDNPEKIAEEFCKKNMLNKESYNKIVTIIKYKLLEIKN